MGPYLSLGRFSQVKMRSYWTKAGPNPMTEVLIRRVRFGHKDRRNKACENRGRDRSDAVASQGMPRISSHHQKLEEAGKDSSHRADGRSKTL